MKDILIILHSLPTELISEVVVHGRSINVIDYGKCLILISFCCLPYHILPNMKIAQCVKGIDQSVFIHNINNKLLEQEKEQKTLIFNNIARLTAQGK